MEIMEAKGTRALEALNQPNCPPALRAAMDDLTALYSAEALTGISEILRVRRRIIEHRGEHVGGYDESSSAELLTRAERCLHRVREDAAAGSYPNATAEQLATAAAYCAAEIDHLALEARHAPQALRERLNAPTPGFAPGGFISRSGAGSDEIPAVLSRGCEYPIPGRDAGH